MEGKMAERHLVDVGQPKRDASKKQSRKNTIGVLQWLLKVATERDFLDNTSGNDNREQDPGHRQERIGVEIERNFWRFHGKDAGQDQSEAGYCYDGEQKGKGCGSPDRP